MEQPTVLQRTLTFRAHKIFPLIQTRSMNSLPMQVVNIINMLTLDEKFPPTIVGSYKYVVHEYPNDIDLFEFTRGCCSKDEVLKKIVDKFKEIIQTIEKQTHTYLGDFKAGIDDRYIIDIGKMSNKKIHGYDPVSIRERLRILYDDGLLDAEDLQKMLKAVINEPSMMEYLALKDLVHKMCTVRWTPEEVLQGFKKLPKNKLLSFEDALSQQSVVKIDVWTNVAGRYMEITNWYAITYLENGALNAQFLSEPMPNYEESLMKDLNAYKNPSLRKSMKFAKRLWNYYVLKNMRKEMVLLYPLFSSGAAKMYQIMGEIEVIINILTWIKTEKINMESVKNNVEDWKTRLGTLMFDALPIETSEAIFRKVNEILGARSKKYMVDALNDIQEKLELCVDKYVRKYLKKNKIDVTF